MLQNFTCLRVKIECNFAAEQKPAVGCRILNAARDVNTKKIKQVNRLISIQWLGIHSAGRFKVAGSAVCATADFDKLLVGDG
jgi:hypothetical protein